MTRLAPSNYAELRPGLVIASIKSTIVDVPTVRRHKLSSLSVTQQSYVIVELQLANGVTGIGEAATLGGPRWSEESVESIKATIDAYLAPTILDELADRFELLGARMDASAKRNNAAKAAVETALFDAVGKTLRLPAALLLGGVVRDRSPCSGRWPRATLRKRLKRLKQSFRHTFIIISKSRSVPRRQTTTWCALVG